MSQTSGAVGHNNDRLGDSGGQEGGHGRSSQRPVEGHPRLEKKKLKDGKKPRKKRKALEAEVVKSVSRNHRESPPYETNEQEALEATSPDNNEDTDGGEGAAYEPQDERVVVMNSRKAGPKKGKKKKEGKLREKKGESDRSRNEDSHHHHYMSARRLPTASSRSNSAAAIATSQDADRSESSQPPTPTTNSSNNIAITTGRVKKSKKKAAAAAAAAAFLAESNPPPPGGLTSTSGTSGYSAAQAAVNDMMRRALEEDQYSALGSIVDTDSSDDEEDDRNILVVTSGTSSSKRGGAASIGADSTSMVRLDRNVILSAMRKRLRIEGMRGGGGGNVIESRKGSNTRSVLVEEYCDTVDGVGGGSGMMIKGEDERASTTGRGGRKKKRKKGKRGGVRSTAEVEDGGGGVDDNDEGNFDGESVTNESLDNGDGAGEENDDEIVDEFQGESESSIFGQTTGSSNATWVECDKCKKWRRLRGVVDTKKLPSKWYCAMNKNDPDRAKCSAPEEEYESPNTPESATDQRIRKHLRLWVRRLQCNEAYEARLPTMTRGKKRSATSSAKEPYEWIRCCNPSCGKWRALLKFMDASTVMESTKNGEWFCVLNTWDEKTASCAAPQESLPAIGCPPWVMQDND